jgi:hypothetical protein
MAPRTRSLVVGAAIAFAAPDAARRYLRSDRIIVSLAADETASPDPYLAVRRSRVLTGRERAYISPARKPVRHFLVCIFYNALGVCLRIV